MKLKILAYSLSTLGIFYVIYKHNKKYKKERKVDIYTVKKNTHDLLMESIDY
jgi:hypothetical protein